MSETDQQFIRRLKTTYGSPSTADCLRMRRIENDAMWGRILDRIRKHP